MHTEALRARLHRRQMSKEWRGHSLASKAGDLGERQRAPPNGLQDNLQLFSKTGMTFRQVPLKTTAGFINQWKHLGILCHVSQMNPRRSYHNTNRFQIIHRCNAFIKKITQTFWTYPWQGLSSRSFGYSANRFHADTDQQLLRCILVCINNTLDRTLNLPDKMTEQAAGTRQKH